MTAEDTGAQAPSFLLGFRTLSFTYLLVLVRKQA